MTLYFDNAATTKPLEVANQAMIDIEWENPHSLHKGGIRAASKIRECEEYIKRYIGRPEARVYFFSSASEATKILFDILREEYGFRPWIVTSSVEHKCVKANIRHGDLIDTIKQKPYSREFAYNESTELLSPVLLSIIHVEPETGLHIGAYKNNQLSIKHWQELDSAVHLDITQSFNKLDPSTYNFADFLTFSAHKFHGPKGVGVLVITNNDKFQTKYVIDTLDKMHFGTPNTPAIYSLLKVMEVISHTHFRYEIAPTHYYLESKLQEYGVLNFSYSRGEIGIISFQVPGVNKLELVFQLAEQDVAISAGSACSIRDPLSQTLQAFGLSEAENLSTIRISLGYLNYTDEAISFCFELEKAITKLRS